MEQVLGDTSRFKIYVTPPNGARVDVTKFRGKPTQIRSWSFADPFGPATASISFPQVTILEESGQGDLWWMVPDADVDIVEYDADGKATDWSWEGFLASEELGETERSWTCMGAALQLKFFQVKPQVQVRPIPVERIIKDAFDPRSSPTLRTRPLRIDWPKDWPTKVTLVDVTRPYAQLVPDGVTVGDRWSGFAQRDTGSWGDKLSLVTNKLEQLVAPDGSQWTVMMDPGRQPVMRVRQMKFRPDADTFVMQAGTPGLQSGSISRDHSQSKNAIYGTGRGLDGQAFSNMSVAGDGITTVYEPFAELPAPYARREEFVQFDDGLDHPQAVRAARARLGLNADPGYAGNFSLTTDPMRDGKPVSRFLIRAGDTILIKGLAGKNVLFHVTEVSVDLASLTVSITVDSKYRSAITVDEVCNRTRDSLNPIRALTLGKFTPAISDLILPWSYSPVAGCIPYKEGSILLGSPPFPWTGYLKQFPPAKYKDHYVCIPKSEPGRDKAASRWATFKVYVGQEASIRLSQFCFVDADGNTLPVRFHVSIYNNNGITSDAMPKVGANDKKIPYDVGQPYPFVKDAWQSTKTSGEEYSLDSQSKNVAAEQAQIGWGTDYEPAGFWPGRASALGSKPTGMLVDEAEWTASTTSNAGVDWKPYDAAEVRSAAFDSKNTEPSPGWLYGMVFCDDIIDRDIYMIGRLYRKPSA